MFSLVLDVYLTLAHIHTHTSLPPSCVPCPQILIKNFSNEVTKKCTPPHPNTDGMHFGGTSGRLLLRCEDRMTLYEQQSRKVLAELQVCVVCVFCVFCVMTTRERRERKKCTS